MGRTWAPGRTDLSCFPTFRTIAEHCKDMQLIMNKLSMLFFFCHLQIILSCGIQRPGTSALTTVDLETRRDMCFAQRTMGSRHPVRNAAKLKCQIKNANVMERNAVRREGKKIYQISYARFCVFSFPDTDLVVDWLKLDRKIRKIYRASGHGMNTVNWALIRNKNVLQRLVVTRCIHVPFQQQRAVLTAGWRSTKRVIRWIWTNELGQMREMLAWMTGLIFWRWEMRERKRICARNWLTIAYIQCSTGLVRCCMFSAQNIAQKLCT